MGLPPCASLMLPEPTQYRGGLSSRSSTTERPPRQESPDRPEARLRSTFGYSSRPLLRDLYFTLSAQSQAGKATVELVRRERSRRRPTHEPYDKNTPVAAPRAQRGGCGRRPTHEPYDKNTSTMATVRRIWLSRIAAVLTVAALSAGACSDGADNEATPAQPDSTLATPTTTTDAPQESSPSTTASDQVAASWPHDWTEERVGGGRFDAGDYEGQDLVLWFWAPW